MAEGELKQVGQVRAKTEEQGRVRVLYGVHALEAALAGRSIRDVRAALQQALNISPRAVAVVNGREVGADYLLKEGEQLEFVRLAGEKGACPMSHMLSGKA